MQPALEAARLESAARRTAAFLDDARLQAVLDRAPVVVQCLPREGRLERHGRGERVFRVPEEVTLVFCRPERIRYFPQGSSEGLELLLRDGRGRERTVAVGAFTGLSAVTAAAAAP